MTIGEIASLPVFAGHAYLVGEELDALRDRVNAMTVAELCSVFPLPVWNEASLLAGLEYTVSRAEEAPVLFDLYKEDEKSPLTALTGIAAFPVRNARKPVPYVIICPGGSYRHCCKIQEGFPVAKRLNELGFAAFVLQYRTGSSFSFEGAEDDLAAAVKFISENRETFHVSPDDYAVMGFSAGGHIAALWGTKAFGAAAHAQKAAGAVILGYPAVSLEEIEEDEIEALLREVLGDRDRKAYSADLLADDTYPPSFIWAFREDPDVDPFAHGALFAKTLGKLGVPAVCELFEGNLHGVGLGAGTAAEGWLERAVDFWRKQVGDEG